MTGQLLLASKEDEKPYCFPKVKVLDFRYLM